MANLAPCELFCTTLKHNREIIVRDTVGISLDISDFDEMVGLLFPDFKTGWNWLRELGNTNNGCFFGRNFWWIPFGVE